jgi:hypothetical protein
VINPKIVRFRKKVSLKSRNDYWVYTSVYYTEDEEPIVEAELKPVGFSSKKRSASVHQ